MNGSLARPGAAALGGRWKGPKVDWWRGLVQGVLLGVALTSVDVSSLNAFGYLRDGAWHASAVVAIGWVLPGTLLAWTAQLVEGRASAGLIVLSFAVVSLAVTVAGMVFDPVLIARVRPLHDAFAFRAWLILFYGGCFFAYCLLAQRARRVQALLATAEGERLRSTTLADEARADALAARIQPGLLLRALGALQATYPRDAARARALLDELTDFLRLAMPAVRGQPATLRGEMSLLRAWSNLAALIEPGGGPPPVRLPDAGGAPTDDAHFDAPFPARTLVPLVERLLAQRWTDSGPVRVTWQHEASALRLTIAVDSMAPGWLEGALEQQIARALRELYGCDANLEVGTTGCVFDLRLPTPAREESVDVAAQ